MEDTSCQHAFIDLLASDWPSFVSAIVSVWLACIATYALTTWKKQSKAKRQLDFMDQFTDAVHELIGMLDAPLEVVRIIKIGITSHSKPNQEPDIQSVIEYKKTYGKDVSKQLFEYLKPCKQAIFKVQSLLTKGQVLGLNDYDKCKQACEIIVRQPKAMEGMGVLLALESLNLDNPEVKKHLSSILTPDAGKMDQAIGEANVQFIVFVRSNYRSILK